MCCIGCIDAVVGADIVYNGVLTAGPVDVLVGR